MNTSAVDKLDEVTEGVPYLPGSLSGVVITNFEIELFNPRRGDPIYHELCDQHLGTRIGFGFWREGYVHFWNDGVERKRFLSFGEVGLGGLLKFLRGVGRSELDH